MSESQKPLQILDIFNTQNFITNKDYVTYKAQGLVTVPNGLKFGDGSYLNGDLYSVNGTLVLDLGTDGTDATFNGDVNGDVYGDIYNSSSIKVFDTDTQTFSGNLQIHQAFDVNYVSGSIKFSTNNATATWDVAEIESYINAGPGNNNSGYPGGLAFKTNDVVGGSPGNDVTTKMVINAAGNVGIGTTDPEEKIHVIGNALVTGSIEGASLTDGTATLTGGALTGLTSLTATTVTGNVTGDLTGDIYNSANQQVLDTGDGTVSNPATFLTTVNFTSEANFTGTMLINSTLNLTNNHTDMAFDFISDTDTGIRYNLANSFNLVAGNNDIFSVSQYQTTTNGTMKIVETGGTYGSASAGSLELYHGSGNASSIIFHSGNSTSDYGFIRYLDDWTNESDLNGYSDLLLGSGGNEKSALFIGTQDNETGGNDDSIVIRPAASLVLDTGTSSSEVSTNAGNIYMKPNGGSVVIGSPDITDVTSSVQQTYQGIPLTVCATDYQNSDILETLKLERKLNDIGGSGDPNNDGGGYIGMHVNETGNQHEMARIAWRATNTSTNPFEKFGKLEFYTRTATVNTTTLVKRMTINYDGNVGIGTETPTSLLDVDGSISATSVSSTGTVSGASVSATGTVSGASVSATGAVSGASVSTTGEVSCSYLIAQNQPFSFSYSRTFSTTLSDGPILTFPSGLSTRASITLRITANISADVTGTSPDVYYNNHTYITGLLVMYPGRFPIGNWGPNTSGTSALYYFDKSGGNSSLIPGSTPWVYFNSGTTANNALFGSTIIKEETFGSTWSSGTTARELLSLLGNTREVEFRCKNTTLGNGEADYSITVEILHVNRYWSGNITYTANGTGRSNHMPIVIG